jgi:hypothetical protein
LVKKTTSPSCRTVVAVVVSVLIPTSHSVYEFSCLASVVVGLSAFAKLVLRIQDK